MTQQGFFTIASPCGACQGQGTVIRNKCNTCRGAGRNRKQRTVTVTIPAGVDSGVNLRLTNEGDAGPHGGPAGHMYVQLRVRKDPFFQRDGSDVHVEVLASGGRGVGADDGAVVCDACLLVLFAGTANHL